MQYLLAIYGEEKAMEGKTEDQMNSVMAAWFQFDESLRKSVNVLGGDALQPTATATTIRANGGGTVTSDGPFAETKEQLGGFYLIDVKDLDEALEWAAKMPNIPEGGAVEVRPIMVFNH